MRRIGLRRRQGRQPGLGCFLQDRQLGREDDTLDPAFDASLKALQKGCDAAVGFEEGRMSYT